MTGIYTCVFMYSLRYGDKTSVIQEVFEHVGTFFEENSL